MAWDLAPKLAVILGTWLEGGSFSACWRLPDVVPVPKGFSSLDARDCRSISITHILPKLLEKVVAGKLSHFLEGSSLFPPSQSLYLRNL